jgi:hypothetical protein
MSKLNEKCDQTTESDDSIQKDKDKQAKKDKRKKILEQMEFYFSDSSLSKDRFLKQEMSSNKDGCNIETFRFSFLKEKFNF